MGYTAGLFLLLQASFLCKATVYITSYWKMIKIQLLTRAYNKTVKGSMLVKIVANKHKQKNHTQISEYNNGLLFKMLKMYPMMTISLLNFHQYILYPY